MNDQEGKDRMYGDREGLEAKKPDLVQSCRGLREAQPAKGEGEGDSARKNDAPEDALVRYPTIEASPANKLLSK